jgi:hypothetical protein
MSHPKKEPYLTASNSEGDVCDNRSISLFQGEGAAISEERQYPMEHLLLLHVFPVFPSISDIQFGQAIVQWHCI